MRALALVFVLLLAGCVSVPGAEDDAGSDVALADPIVEQHDHADPAEHALWTPNMEKLGFTALGEEPGATRGTYGEIDIHGDTAYVAVLGDGGETPGLAIVDITTREDPQLVSFTPSLGTRLADVKGEPTNSFAFLGGERSLPTSQGRAGRTATDLAGALAAADPDRFRTRNGIRVYDVGDPTRPAEVAFAPSDSGCHMVYYKEYAGGEWVFCVGTAIMIYEFDRAGPSLSLAARYQPQPSEVVPFVVSDPTDAPTVVTFDTVPHDMTLQDDVASGKILMYVSYWDLGLRIVDVSDPAQPAELGKWLGEGSERYVGSIHTAMAQELPDGRRIVYAIPELFTDSSVPAIFVVDATDLAAPTYVGEWAAPGEHPNDGIRFSTHNFQIVGGRLYLAYYHAGVWVLDVSGENAIAPKALGYYLPHESVKTQIEGADVPSTWDVVLKDGYIYATDINTGLYVLHFRGDMLEDPALTSSA